MQRARNLGVQSRFDAFGWCYPSAAMTADLLRSWRVLILAWAVLMAPQTALVHALAHSPLPALAQGVAASPSDAKHPGAGLVCDICLACAQFGAALPTDPNGAAALHAGASPRPLAPLPGRLLPHQPAGFEARGPPSLPV